MDIDSIVAVLGLEPGGTCGYTATTFVAGFDVATEPDRSSRPGGAALYFLVTPDHPVHLHCIASDQIYHHYAGDPLQVLTVTVSGDAHEAIVGPDLEAGMTPQLLIPASTYHAGRTTGAWSLLGTTSWPAVADGEADIPEPAAFAQSHPSAADLIHRYCKDEQG
jgi:uncharacterized protein